MVLAKKRKRNGNLRSTQSCGCGNGAMAWIVEHLNHCVLIRSWRPYSPERVLVKADTAPQIAAVAIVILLPQSLRRFEEGLCGGVIRVFAVSCILMLSQVSAPSRVPQVVFDGNQPRVKSMAVHAGPTTYLCDSDAAVELD